MRATIHLVGLMCVWALARIAVGAAESQTLNTWFRSGDGPASERTGGVLLYDQLAARLLLFGGEIKGAATVQAFDLATMPVRDSGIDRAHGVLDGTVAVSVFAQPRPTAHRLTQSSWTGPWPPFGDGHVGNPAQGPADQQTHLGRT